MEPEEKLDPGLRKIVEENPGQDLPVPVIVQTVDGLQAQDREMLQNLKGSFKDDLWLIKAYSADIPSSSLSLLALSPRVVKIYHDADIRK